MCLYSRSRRPKHFPEFVVVFLLYFLISLHSLVTSVALGFPVAVLSTHMHAQSYNLTQVSVVFALQETHTHCVIFAVSTKADVEVTQHKHESRASSFLMLLYVDVFLVDSDHINFTCFSKFFSEHPDFP